MTREILTSPLVHHFRVGDRPAPYSPAVAIDSPRRLIFVSGQVAVSADGEIVGRGDIKAQTKQALQNITALLERAGADWNDVVKTTVFIADPSLFPGYLEARMEWLEHEPPSSTAVVAPPVNPQYLIEIEAIAAIGDTR